MITLREISMRENGHEPPLCNPYHMQWFLTLFGNTLPRESILRIWDGLMLDGNEILIRTALAIWKFFSADIINATTTDQFYQSMNSAMDLMLDGKKIPEYDLISVIYSMASFPFPNLDKLRIKYSHEFIKTEK